MQRLVPEQLATLKKWVIREYKPWLLLLLSLYFFLPLRIFYDLNVHLLGKWLMQVNCWEINFKVSGKIISLIGFSACLGYLDILYAWCWQFKIKETINRDILFYNYNNDNNNYHSKKIFLSFCCPRTHHVTCK